MFIVIPMKMRCIMRFILYIGDSCTWFEKIALHDSKCARLINNTVSFHKEKQMK